MRLSTGNIKNVWIGGRKLPTKEWVWVKSGEVLEDNRKVRGTTEEEPSCLSLDWTDFFPSFVSENCSTKKGFVCEKSKIKFLLN